jgi:hypothetical protein
MKKFLLPLFLLGSVLVKSQESKPPVYFKTAINVSPFALAQVDNTVMAGIEYRLRNNITLVGDAGYIFYSKYFSESKGASGFIIRPGIRFYLNKRNNFYVEPQIFYKQVSNKMHDWLEKEVVNGVSAYQQLQDFRYKRQVMGSNFLIGGIFPFSGNKGYIDIYLGIGIRYKSNSIVGEPHSVYRRDGMISIYSDNITLPSVPGGVRIAFILD